MLSYKGFCYSEEFKKILSTSQKIFGSQSAVRTPIWPLFHPSGWCALPSGRQSDQASSVWTTCILPRFWHLLHISSHPMIFFVSSVILLSLCAFRILEYLLGYSIEILCMKILFCLCVGLIMIYLCLMSSCIAYISLWHPFDSLVKYHIMFGTNRI